jgi:hypothetical protein
LGLISFAFSWCSLAFGHYLTETNRLAAKTHCIIEHKIDYLTVCKHYGSDAIAPFSYRKALLG